METTICENCQTNLGPDSPAGMCPKCLMQLAYDQQKKRSTNGEKQTQERNSQQDSPPRPEQIADLFPELDILDIVGHGGMGVVYKARQKNLGRIVAVKILSTQLLDDPAFAERFSREARAMAMMNHPNIIAIYDFGCRDEHYYLVMEYVDGLNLRQLVSTGELKPGDAIQMVPQLCDALQYAHDRGVIHRDIKPENVLISQEGQVKIADFGLAKLTNSQQNLTLTQTRQIMGTPNYMAPEQREKPVDVDHRADIYSLGVVIYELLTGELPLGRFAPPSTKAQVDARIDELVMRALEKEPQLRFQKVSELKTGIESLASRKKASPHQLQNQQGEMMAHQNPGNDGGQTHASKVWKFVVMSFGILVGISGILLIILSGLAEDFDNDRFDKRLLQVGGFVALASCGVIFALYGIYSHVFHNQNSSGDPATKNEAPISSHVFHKKSSSSYPATQNEAPPAKPKPASALILTGLGTIMCFTCAAFFTVGSFIPGVSSWQGGIGSALLAGCIFSIAELIENSYDPNQKNDHSDQLGSNPPCPRCGKELKSNTAKQCFACGYDWK